MFEIILNSPQKLARHPKNKNASNIDVENPFQIHSVVVTQPILFVRKVFWCT